VFFEKRELIADGFWEVVPTWLSSISVMGSRRWTGGTAKWRRKSSVRVG
jgi:hypothetical protein